MPLAVAGAWRRGYTGKGVVVSVLGDGVEPQHPALEPNYVSVLEEDRRSPGISSSQRPQRPSVTAATDILGRALFFWADGFGKSQPGLLVQT